MNKLGMLLFMYIVNGYEREVYISIDMESTIPSDRTDLIHSPLFSLMVPDYSTRIYVH